MARKLRPGHPSDAYMVEIALGHLHAAARLLREADCPQAAAKAQAASRSTAGAVRHMKRRVFHSAVGG